MVIDWGHEASAYRKDSWVCQFWVPETISAFLAGGLQTLQRLRVSLRYGVPGRTLVTHTSLCPTPQLETSRNVLGSWVFLPPYTACEWLHSLLPTCLSPFNSGEGKLCSVDLQMSVVPSRAPIRS